MSNREVYSGVLHCSMGILLTVACLMKYHLLNGCGWVKAFWILEPGGC